MRCFAYGSNMSSRRLLARTPSARFLGVAHLHGHRLKFHKYSRVDGSAKCDARYSGVPADRVIGVLFEIDASEKPMLDRAEGLGAGYEEAEVAVRRGNGEIVLAQVYVATDIVVDLRPWDWYRAHVLAGALEHGLPDDYVDAIRAIPFATDPDAPRRRRELAVYPATSALLSGTGLE